VEVAVFDAAVAAAESTAILHSSRAGHCVGCYVAIAAVVSMDFSNRVVEIQRHRFELDKVH
jgi:hypothetical protein